MENAHPPALTHLERAAVAVDAALGVALVAVAAVLLVQSLGARADPYSPHGGAFEMLAAVLLGPPGMLLLVAAVGVARRWRGRWWLHALLLLWPVALYAVGMAGGLLR